MVDLFLQWYLLGVKCIQQYITGAKFMKKPSMASKIKKKRLELELTQEALAIKAGIPYATLSKIESGKVTNPTVTTLKKIADALDLSLDNLVEDINP